VSPILKATLRGFVTSIVRAHKNMAATNVLCRRGVHFTKSASFDCSHHKGEHLGIGWVRACYPNLNNEQANLHQSVVNVKNSI
jgi:hypothetical protein